MTDFRIVDVDDAFIHAWFPRTLRARRSPRTSAGIIGDLARQTQVRSWSSYLPASALIAACFKSCRAGQVRQAIRLGGRRAATAHAQRANTVAMG